MKLGDRIQDRYVLEQSLGTGGMAEVWKARDERLERSVAIKFLAPKLAEDPEFLVRFFSEAQSVARISHPNVVSILDFGEADGSPYLVMEHVPGGAVSELTGEPIQPERAAEIVRDAALGAGAAHGLGIVHRDIKPGNILLCDDGRATVADFGIARSAVSEKLTATGQVIGSPHYIAPEQASGKGARAESDVYALGIVLYELLTGRPPFDADNATAIAIAHVDSEPDAPSARGAEIDPELDALVLRCLAKDPAARFTDGTALAAALETVVPSISGFAPVLPAAALAPEVTDQTEVVADTPPPTRRGTLVAISVLLAVAMLAGGAWAVLRNDEPRESSVASASEPDYRRKKEPRPSESPTSHEDNSGEIVATDPSPTPSEPDDEEQRERSDTDRVAQSDSDQTGGSGYYSGGGEEPEAETSPSPTSSPTPEETTEPTPEPSEPPEEAP